MKKKITAFILTGIMALSFVTPSLAAQVGGLNIPNPAEESTEIKTTTDSFGDTVYYATGKADPRKGWVWINGYCYYYAGNMYTNMLKNTTTPDGYQVDKQGRWCENGKAVFNGLGSRTIGTDALFAGKSDDERWVLQRDYLRKLFADEVTLDKKNKNTEISMYSHDNEVIAQYPGRAMTIGYKPLSGDLLSISINNYWVEDFNNVAPKYAEIYEKMIRILLGDKTGQEFFNDIKAAGDSVSGGTTCVPDLDSNGQLQFYTNENGLLCYKCHYEGGSSDGINFNLFDIAKWNNKKTDYGKSIRVENVDTYYLIRVK